MGSVGKISFPQNETHLNHACGAKAMRTDARACAPSPHSVVQRHHTSGKVQDDIMDELMAAPHNHLRQYPYRLATRTTHGVELKESVDHFSNSLRIVAQGFAWPEVAMWQFKKCLNSETTGLLVLSLLPRSHWTKICPQAALSNF